MKTKSNFRKTARSKTAKRKGSSAPCRGAAEPIPMVLFRGEAVWRELNDEERTRTTAINVSDVLDAVVRLMRREARQNDRTLRRRPGIGRIETETEPPFAGARG